MSIRIELAKDVALAIVIAFSVLALIGWWFMIPRSLPPPEEQVDEGDAEDEAEDSPPGDS